MNRYTQLQYGDFSRLPQLQLPYAELDQLLAGHQQQKDLTDAIMAKPFDHLTDSESDRQLAQEVNAYQNELKNQLATIAQEGDVGKYMDALKQSQRELLKMRSPGGSINALESRKASLAEMKKNYKERLQEQGAPREVINQFLSMIQPGEVRDEYGGYRGISDPNLGSYEKLPEVMDDLLKGWASDQNAILRDDGKWVYEGTNEFVKEEDIQNFILQTLNNPRFRDQLRAETSINEQLFSNIADPQKRREAAYTYTMQNYTDPLMEKYGFNKRKLGKDANAYGVIDHDHSYDMTTMNMELYSNDPGMGENPFKQFNNKGKLNPEIGGALTSNYIASGGLGSGSQTYNRSSGRQQGGGTTIQEYIKEKKEEWKTSNPSAYSIIDKFEKDLENMSPAQAKDFLDKKWKEREDVLSVQNSTVQVYRDPDLQKDQQDLVIGTNAPGLAGSMNVTVTTPGQPAEMMTFNQFRKEFGIDNEQWTKNARIIGEMDPTNALTPNGYVVNYSGEGKGKSGKNYQLILSNTSEEEFRMQQPIHHWWTAATKDNIKKTEAIHPRTGIPEIDSKNIYSKAQDMWTSDILARDIQNDYKELQQYEKGTPGYKYIKNRIDTKQEELRKVRNNPNLNEFKGTEAILYDIENDEPLGLTIQQMNELTRAQMDQMRGNK